MTPLHLLGIPLGLAAANFGEWFIHKHILHGLGRNKDSFWSFHWHEHHRASRKSDFIDPSYRRSLFGWHAQSREALGLVGMGLLVTPLVGAAPLFVGAVWYSTYRYYKVHKRAHLDPEWAREHLPWHYDHHMAPNQDANWCVTKPWFDELLGTRIPYVGTAREIRDRHRRETRSARKTTRATTDAAVATAA